MTIKEREESNNERSTPRHDNGEHFGHDDSEKKHSHVYGFPFSEEEIENLRELIRREERKKWLRAAVSGWVAWISLVMTSVVAGWDTIKRILKSLVDNL